MKSKNLIRNLLIAGLFIFTFQRVTAQIKVDATGNVALGSTASPSSTYDTYTNTLKVGSNAYISSMTVGSNVSLSGYQGPMIFDFYGYGARQLRPTINNQCMVGTSSYAFNKMYSYSFITISDRRQKENIKDITGSLSIVKSLKGIKYDFKKEIFIPRDLEISDEYKEKLEKSRKNKLGFIAQDVFEVLPEVIIYDDSTDIYAIDYSKIVPVLVEAIKEQQVIIETLQSDITALENQIMTDPQLKSTFEGNDISESFLYQNTPNPFTEKTKILYYLSESVKNATINIYNMNGTKLESVELHQLGYGNITINSGEYNAGMYIYTLLINGQLIDSKQMLLTD